jgi:hypothetical protein
MDMTGGGSAAVRLPNVWFGNQSAGETGDRLLQCNAVRRVWHRARMLRSALLLQRGALLIRGLVQ